MNQILHFALVNHWNEYQCSYEGLERKFVQVISLLDIQRIQMTQYLAQYNGLERSQMVWKGVNWARVLKWVKNEHFWQ